MSTALLRAALLTAAACVALSASTAVANAPNPDLPAKRASNALPDRKRAQLVVESRDFDREIVLVLPEELNPAGARATASTITPLQTTVSGAAISLALVAGGLWLTRSRREPRARAAVAGVAVVAAISGAAGYALGNATPYPEGDADPGTLRALYPDGKTLSGQVRVLYRSKDGTVHLTIPKKYFADE
jgi:hypothetical protein